MIDLGKALKGEKDLNDYKDAKAERKPSGHIIVDGQEVANTMQCCHCGQHFVSVKGSGKLSGFCMRCHKITCGSPKCDPCIPFEKKVEEYESGKRLVL